MATAERIAACHRLAARWGRNQNNGTSNSSQSQEDVDKNEVHGMRLFLKQPPLTADQQQGGEDARGEQARPEAGCRSIGSPASRASPAGEPMAARDTSISLPFRSW